MHRQTLVRTTLLTTLLAALVFAGGLLPSAHAQQSEQITIVSPQEPKTLLPHFDQLTLAQEIQSLAYDCLLTLNAEGDYVPELATNVPSLDNGGISADGTTYTFRLREGVQWADGEPFTAEDVRFTWQVLDDPDVAVPSRGLWDDIEDVEIVDTHEVKIRFPDTNVSFLGAAATENCFVLPEHRLSGTDIANSDLNRTSLGTGPFVVEEWQSGSFIRLSKNPNYWKDGLPKLDQIRVRFIPGTAGQRASLERGETDLQLDLTTADFRFVEDLDNYTVEQTPIHAWWMFWLNNEDPILQDREVRQALAYAVDKSLITETVMGDIVRPQSAALPPSHWAHNPDVKQYAFNPERARELLENAGWTLGSGGVRTKDGERLSVEILNIAGQAERRQVIQIVQSQWREVGAEVAIREIDAANFPPTMADGDYQVAYGWFSEKQAPVFNLWLGTNWQRYANDEAFELLEQVPETIDRDQRKDLIQRFQAIVAEDVPILPLAPRAVLNAVNDRLQGYDPGLSGSLWNAETWSVEP